MKLSHWRVFLLLAVGVVGQLSNIMVKHWISTLQSYHIQEKHWKLIQLYGLIWLNYIEQ